jgi:O-succinylbenzoic acid--CoA ligase
VAGGGRGSSELSQLPEGTVLAVPTSGSTGPPKLVALDADAVRASAKASAERLGGAGHWLLALPVSHIAGMNVVLRACLAGAPPYSLPPGPFTAQGFAQATAALPPGPKFTSLVPTQLRRLAAAGPTGSETLKQFDAVLVGGAALDPRLREWGEAAGLRLVETYGSAETCGGCVYDGQPLDGTSVQITPGGRIEVTGPTLALGYAPADPAQPGFVERDGQRWFVSSDLGQWAPDGRLEILGRADNAITTGGQTVSPENVEAMLRTVPGVADVLVVGLPEPNWGQSLTALVVPDSDRSPNLEELRQVVKELRDPAHAPRGLALVKTLPRLESGKPDRAGAARAAAGLETSGHLERLL